MENCDAIDDYNSNSGDADEYLQCMCYNPDNYYGTDSTVYWDEDYYGYEPYSSLITTSLYTSTTMTTNSGSYVELYNLPWDDTGSDFCDWCGWDVDPCTVTGGPFDVYDCDGNLCSDYDRCADILTTNPPADDEDIMA